MIATLIYVVAVFVVEIDWWIARADISPFLDCAQSLSRAAIRRRVARFMTLTATTSRISARLVVAFPSRLPRSRRQMAERLGDFHRRFSPLLFSLAYHSQKYWLTISNRWTPLEQAVEVIGAVKFHHLSWWIYTLRFIMAMRSHVTWAFVFALFWFILIFELAFIKTISLFAACVSRIYSHTLWHSTRQLYNCCALRLYYDTGSYCDTHTQNSLAGLPHSRNFAIMLVAQRTHALRQKHAYFTSRSQRVTSPACCYRYGVRLSTLHNYYTIKPRFIYHYHIEAGLISIIILAPRLAYDF